MYHVFIVDEQTFKYHLEYMFAGTGAKEEQSPFITNPQATQEDIHHATERGRVSMIADISRIRVGDKIIFYLQASGEGKSGKFFGVFCAISKAFFDENNSNNYLKSNLGKGLSFRILIEPDMVYPQGITEHELLDEISGITHPYQMCWSLIYRKLRANRGCTMITEHEFNTLDQKLRAKNNNVQIQGTSMTFDGNQIVSNSTSNTYTGRQNSLDILPRLLHKYNNNSKAFEYHLQTYILQNFDTNTNLNNLLLPLVNFSCWIGNEVSCGVGMQRIDILIVQQDTSDVYIKVIELKCIKPDIDILDFQIPWYISWVDQYIAPNYTGKKVHIIPCIIAKNTNDQNFLTKVRNFTHNSTNTQIMPAEYIAFSIASNQINFSKII